MKIVSCNLNGIRSAHRKGFFDWYKKQKCDVLCIQELKAQVKDLSDKHISIRSEGCFLKSVMNCAKRPGYSGVSILSKKEPNKIIKGIGSQEFDQEGRVIRADFDNNLKDFPFFSLICLYLPSGSSSSERQEAKFRFLDNFKKQLKYWMYENKGSGREFVLCGDWNIAYQEIDLKNWRNNMKNSGFLPEERKWLSQMVFEEGWVDVYRKLEPQTTQYTWWSQRGKARDNNVGWRIDYQIATPRIASKAIKTRVEMLERFSDHAPLIIEYS